MFSIERHHGKSTSVKQQSTVPVMGGANGIATFSGNSLTSGPHSGAAGSQGVAGARGIILANIPTLESFKNSTVLGVGFHHFM